MLFYFASHRKIASQFFSVTNMEENHRCDAIAIPGYYLGSQETMCLTSAKLGQITYKISPENARL